jgi:hypothetical protein
MNGTCEAIPRQLGYASRATVFAIVQKTVDAHEAEEVDRFRSLEAARLDQLQVSIWSRAMTGDVAAVAQTPQPRDNTDSGTVRSATT